MTVSPAGVRLSVWMAVFTGITTAVIALRIWAVRLTRKSLQLSDYLVIVAYVCSQFILSEYQLMHSDLDRRNGRTERMGHCQWVGRAYRRSVAGGTQRPIQGAREVDHTSRSTH